MLGIGARCVWVTSTDMEISLGPGATIVPALIRRRLAAGCDPEITLALRPVGVVPPTESCVLVSPPPVVPTPVPVIVAPTSIGVCDGLELDSSQSGGTAGRRMALAWAVVACVASGEVHDVPAGEDLINSDEVQAVLIPLLEAASSASSVVVSLPASALPVASITTFRCVRGELLGGGACL